MLHDLLTIGALQLCAVISPGPDFAMLVKNTLSYSRRAGIITAAGIASAVAVHLSYCILGLALVISQSLLLFTAIKYLGAAYLIYIGLRSLFSPKVSPNKMLSQEVKQAIKHKKYHAGKLFLQGFLCNLLNPKAILFFLGLFTLVIQPHTPYAYQLSYAVEIVLITFAWFAFLAAILGHKFVTDRLPQVQNIINKIIGVLLIIFGTELALFYRH